MTDLYFTIVSLAITLLSAGTWLSYRAAVARRRTESIERLKTLVGEGDVASRAGGGPRRNVYLRLPRRMRVALARADFQLAGGQIAMGVATVGIIVASALALSGPLAAAFAFAIAIAGAWWALERAAERRRQQCIQSLPAFLDGIRQLVKVGNSLMQALEKATATAPPAVSRYFQPIVTQLQHGVPLGDAVAQTADRLDMLELHMFAAAIQSNLRFGGRIGQILENLIRILRDRSQIEREISSSTAETRTTALVLGALPFLVGGWIGFNNPDYAAFFIDDPSGHAILKVVVPMQVIGLLAMRRIIGVTY